MKLLSIEAVAEVFGLSRQTVTRMVIEGSLPAICLRSGKRKKIWRIREEVLQRWLEQKEKAQTEPRRIARIAK
jgi:excisionase family DNA binding protein